MKSACAEKHIHRYIKAKLTVTYICYVKYEFLVSRDTYQFVYILPVRIVRKLSEPKVTESIPRAARVAQWKSYLFG